MEHCGAISGWVVGWDWITQLPKFSFYCFGNPGHIFFLSLVFFDMVQGYQFPFDWMENISVCVLHTSVIMIFPNVSLTIWNIFEILNASQVDGWLLPLPISLDNRCRVFCESLIQIWACSNSHLGQTQHCMKCFLNLHCIGRDQKHGSRRKDSRDHACVIRFWEHNI